MLISIQGAWIGRGQIPLHAPNRSPLGREAAGSPTVQENPPRLSYHPQSIGRAQPGGPNCLSAATAVLVESVKKTITHDLGYRSMPVSKLRQR
jgi:hypothetical protein